MVQVAYKNCKSLLWQVAVLGLYNNFDQKGHSLMIIIAEPIRIVQFF